jgi:hypothetical protein
MATIVLQMEGVDSRHRQQMEQMPLIAARTSLLRGGRHASPLISRLQPPPLSVRPSHWETVVPRVRISRDAPSSTSDCHHAVAWHALITPLQAPLGQVPNLVGRTAPPATPRWRQPR